MKLVSNPSLPLTFDSSATYPNQAFPVQLTANLNPAYSVQPKAD